MRVFHYWGYWRLHHEFRGGQGVYQHRYAVGRSPHDATLGSSDTSGTAGYVSQYYIGLIPPSSQYPEGVSLLITTGTVWNTSSPPIQQANIVAGIPMGSGFVIDPPTRTMPLLGGLSIPAWWLGLGWPALSFEFMGGVDFNRRKATISLGEPGAGPGALPVIAPKPGRRPIPPSASGSSINWAATPGCRSPSAPRPFRLEFRPHATRAVAEFPS